MDVSLPTLSISAANTCLHPIQKTRHNSFVNWPSKKPCLLYPGISASTAAAVSPAMAAAERSNVAELEGRKHDLLRAVQETQRGLSTTAEQRSSIEEALVSVEEFGAGSPVDLAALDGTWRLNYTSAADVLVLFEASARLPFFQVGQIFQKFECRGRTKGGIVRNVVRWSLTNLLEEQEGATLLVTAKFSVLTKRNIYLQFDEVAVENIKVSEELQALIAPAILPRSFLSLQILQFLRTFRAQVPVRGPDKKSPGGLYYLSYLDRDMLLGRAIGGGGIPRDLAARYTKRSSGQESLRMTSPRRNKSPKGVMTRKEITPLMTATIRKVVTSRSPSRHREMRYSATDSLIYDCHLT